MIPLLFQCDNHSHRHSRAGGNPFGGARCDIRGFPLAREWRLPGCFLVALK